jgi:putative nucleotidyltransferase with HDIG domain
MSLTIKAMPSLEGVCRRIHDVSTLPHVAVLVIQVANNPGAGPREMKEVMEVDAPLTARVIRCVNSSAYGLPRKVANLQEAISYLGVNTVRNLAVTASVSKLFKTDVECGLYNRKALWRHLVAVAVCARMIALRLRLSSFEEVYLAGLLHDIGIILEDQYVHPQFVDVLGALREGTPLLDCERARLGFAHTLLGEELSKMWKFPNGITDAIAWHHGCRGYTGTHGETVRCVELANYLCSMKGFSSVGLQLVAFPRDAILELGIGKTDLIVIAEDVDREVNEQQAMFQI